MNYKKILILTLFLFRINLNLTKMDSSCLENQFVIVIPSYNNSNYFKQNLDSIFKQNYKNYRVIYIDDCSQDNTGNLVTQYIKENKIENRITLIRNSKRELALVNLYKAILSCDDNETVIVVDGDDELAHENVLNIINDAYIKENIWITYGNYIYLSNNQPCEWDPTFPVEIVRQNQFRDFPHGLTHLRTFYAWLFKQIKLEDLFHGDSFYKMCSDVAIYLPMIEMAGERFKFFRDTFLYIYNDTNPINDHKISEKLQRDLNILIRQKNKYQRLDLQKNGFLSELDQCKADIVIFPNGVQETESLCHLINKNIKNISKLFVVYETNDEDESNLFENLKSKFDKFVFVGKNKISANLLDSFFHNLIENGSKYIVFIENNIILKQPIDCLDLIKKMELTKAFGLSFVTNNSFTDSFKSIYIEILKNTYAYRSNKLKLMASAELAIYRKKDINISFINSIEKLEKDWKYITQDKICLMSFLNS